MEKMRRSGNPEGFSCIHSLPAAWLRVRDLETRLREQKEKEEQLEQEMLEATTATPPVCFAPDSCVGPRHLADSGGQEMKKKKQKKRAGLAPLGPAPRP